jgi:PadR family transcriptional regulator, regulatory protein PadR
MVDLFEFPEGTVRDPAAYPSSGRSTPSAGTSGPIDSPGLSAFARVSRPKSERSREAVREAVAQAGGLEAAAPAPRSPRAQDPFSGELRRREVLPLLVLHLISDTPSYGNQLMERIAAMTAGVLSVNPNTMYPLLRRLESRGLIRGDWEHPERRTRRYYSLTDEGRGEYERLVEEVRPFLDSVKSSIDEIVREVYGE